jgi:hypothetical protein
LLVARVVRTIEIAASVVIASNGEISSNAAWWTYRTT